MRCKNCGIIIQSGTLCENCYKKMQKNKVSDNDNVVLMNIVRKFNPKYNLLVNMEWILFCILIVLLAILSKNILSAVLCILLVSFILGISMFFSKRKAMGTKLTFYETKVVYRFNFLFIHRQKVLKYSQIRDITLNRRRFQKKFGLGNFNIINKDTGIIFKGIIMEDVANAEEVFKKLTALIGTKIG